MATDGGRLLPVSHPRHDLRRLLLILHFAHCHKGLHNVTCFNDLHFRYYKQRDVYGKSLGLGARDHGVHFLRLLHRPLRGLRGPLRC